MTFDWSWQNGHVWNGVVTTDIKEGETAEQAAQRAAQAVAGPGRVNRMAFQIYDT